MDNMHPVMRAALAPFAPPRSFNDDDLYIVNLRTNTIVQEFGASSPSAELARRQGLAIKPGHALVTGMTVRSMGLVQ